ncbi:lipopolysaccharide biosynthesis protein [Flavivirga jejuensis]|uniref:Oligosaccharide flippase family protein n=1 Tax=Flavivirga jejuensis TaxID=870487 RepID=A0ABT8WR14_9FLAO|nr:oligosaccharide flippase family protein [Flavivirga jejuensis]MDO5975341.1 oligosaccharide flippase family protein [Flavivirga jejuensis]
MIDFNELKKKVLSVNKFTIDTFLYTFGDFLNKGLIFLTIPIFSRILNVEDYGVLSIYQLFYSFLIVLLTINFPGAVTQRLFEKKEKEDLFIQVNLKFITVFSFVFSLVLIVSEVIFDYSSILGLNTKYYYICIVDVFFMGFIGFYQSTLLGKRVSGSYVVNSLITSGGSVLISIVLMLTIFKGNELLGQFLSRLFISVIFCFIVLFRFKDLFKVSITKNKELILYSFSFGVPLIPHLISNLVLRQFDRIIIGAYISISATGIYSLASNLSFVLPVLIGAVNKSWVPIFQDYLRTKSYLLIEKRVKLLSFVFLIVCILLILHADLIFRIVAPVEYFEGYKIFQLLIMGSYFLFAYNSYVNYAYYTRKTYSIALITIVVGLVSFTLNLFLIPKYLMSGAAYSFIIGSFILFLINYLNVRFFLKIKCVSLWVFIKDAIILLAVLLNCLIFGDFLFGSNLGLLIRVILTIVGVILLYRNRFFFINN